MGCSRDDCPTDNTRMDRSTKCGRCNSIVHLPCIGIQLKTTEVLIHPNLRIFCQQCAAETSIPTTTSTNSNSISIQKIIDMNTSNKQHQRQTQITEFTTSSSGKLDEILSMLNNMKTSIESTKENVCSHREETKSTLAVIEQEVTNARPKLSQIVAMNRTPWRPASQIEFPPLATHKNKRAREEEQSETPKTIFKNRKLLSGTDKEMNHGLGNPVQVKSSKPKSPIEHLTKSIYVSRLQTTVTAEQIRHYVKSKIPEMDEKDIALRMLVKKDQPLDDLTFISYRLLCTEEHYNKFMDSSFWPSHILIGEFIDKPRKKHAQLSDFVGTPTKPASKDTPNETNNKDDSRGTELNKPEKMKGNPEEMEQSPIVAT